MFDRETAPSEEIDVAEEAHVAWIQKPIQSNRKGEVAEGLPGSVKSVACVKRNTRELGRPNSFLAAAR